MTNEQFDDFVDKCYEEMEQKQEKLFNTYNIGTYDKYWFDQETKTLQFKNNDEVLLEFNIVCIGTWGHQKNTWMWGWANASFTNEIREDAILLKGLTEYTGYEVFKKIGFECDEVMAYESVAMAVNYLNALGMYKIPGEKSDLFVALMEIK
ncbi:hypothetical protein HZF06_09575 [Clostridium intestinale]|uniref:Uncharacterized protein n=2 Tax=Clostridium intestinale TaxID=36845 RepID=A0A7D6VXP7_9CLOT|nr:hypothetical protein HZF06_09575 [Clostridium intestinale]